MTSARTIPPLVAGGKSTPAPQPVVVTPEMIAAVRLPDAIDLLDRLVSEAASRASRPDLQEVCRREAMHRQNLDDLTVLMAVRQRLVEGLEVDSDRKAAASTDQ